MKTAKPALLLFQIEKLLIFRLIEISNLLKDIFYQKENSFFIGIKFPKKISLNILDGELFLQAIYSYKYEQKLYPINNDILSFYYTILKMRIFFFSDFF